MHLIRAIIGNFRIADALDILFVAVFIYAVLRLLRRTISRAVLAGLVSLAGIYVLARAFDMYMTTIVFQAALTVLVIALIVVFHEDLRNALEHLALLGGMFGGSQRDRSSPVLDTLAEAAYALASRKRGALIVLKGSEPLDRHLRGGIRLDGYVSKALIDGIFDPHSMGHDGAIIVEGDRIRRFATHLPLSKNPLETGSYGTRHAAALGLAEVSDAMVIVVSEERGQISVAEKGVFRAMSSSTQLRRELEAFCDRNFPKPTAAVVKGIMKKDAALKVFCLMLACVAWFVVGDKSDIVQKTFLVPIEYRNVSSDLFVERATPPEVHLTLSGRERDFGLLAPSTLRVSMDLSGIRQGQQEMTIDDSSIRLPSNVSLYRVEPQVVTLEVRARTASPRKDPS
jgi:diadenylate cyclase